MVIVATYIEIDFQSPVIFLKEDKQMGDSHL